MPYLRLIAANGIADALDRRVVENCWAGNRLLDRTDLPAFHRSLEERFRGRVAPSSLEHLLGAAPAIRSP